MEMARLVAQRGTCPRAQVGAVIVKDRRIIRMGYNGAPPAMPHCVEDGRTWVKGLGEKIQENHPLCTPDGCKNAIHAEANALAFAARYGIAVEGASMWCTHAPCLPCAQIMLAAGIAFANYNIAYRDTAGVELLEKSVHCVVIAHDD